MASEIIPDLAPMTKSDTAESSMEREPQGIMINQETLSHLLEQMMTQVLQQISKSQTNPQELKKGDTQLDLVLPELLPEVVEEFQACLSSGNCNRLLEMVKDFPAELFLETFDASHSRSALHVAVLKGSEELVRALVEKLKAHSSVNNSKLPEHEFILKEDKYELSAADMASLIANKEIISCIEEGLQVFNSLESQDTFFGSSIFEAEKKNLLEEASFLLEKPAPTSSDQGTRQLSLREWLHENNVDFVYCLHEAAMNSLPSQRKALEFVEHVCGNGDFSFLEPLLKVRDSLGKSPLHVHDNSNFSSLFEKLVDHFPTLDWNVRDFCGRTPLHWAAAQGDVDLINFLAKQDAIDLNARYTDLCGKKMKTSTNFNCGGVSNVTPLHLAVIHNHVEAVMALLKVEKKQGLNVNAICLRQDQDLNKKLVTTSWTPIQLAAYIGHERIMKKFLEDPRTYDPGFKSGNMTAPVGHNMISVLHLAASQFYTSTMKTLVDCRKMDALVKDKDGNKALHYATMHAHGELQVHANIYDYVTVSHFTSKPPKSRKPSDDDMITCIDILMQSCLHMEARNKEGRRPTLHPSSPEKVQTWWLGKIAKEYQEIKNNLIIAANAILVTAALVATSSFVGPLQPPLGLLDDGSQTWLDGYSKVKHTSVQVFLFCDSLSFYLAITAIVFAMLPSWSIPHEEIIQEVFIARRCVQGSVLLLFGSMIFVVCAFSAASIAIVPYQRWRYMTNAVISTSLGVLICLLILSLSFMRLLALFSLNNEVAKKISDVATRILLWEPVTSRINKEVTKFNE